MGAVQPRYPIYIPSKGRADAAFTARALARDGVPYHLVVEPPEASAYAAAFGHDRVLVLPFADLGLGSIPARNWIKEHAVAAGHKRHWQLDDNIHRFRRWFAGKRVHCDAGVALRVVEDFADRWTNVAVAGLNYTFFSQDQNGMKPHPVYINVHVYSCTLVLNALPYRWRGRYNEDTDYCLQALAGGWCTALVNAFTCDKQATLTMRGGNTTTLYRGDGRLRMARALERNWPGVVSTIRRFRRPQHYVAHNWTKFDTQLVPAPDPPPALGEYGLRAVEMHPPRTPVMQAVLARGRDGT